MLSYRFRGYRVVLMALAIIGLGGRGLRAQDTHIRAILADTNGTSALEVLNASGDPLMTINSQGEMWLLGPLHNVGAYHGDGSGLGNLNEEDPHWHAAAPLITQQAAEGAEAFEWGHHATNGYLRLPEAEGAFVQKTGDTMTGALQIDAGAGSNVVITSSGDTVRIGRDANATSAGVAIGREANGNSTGTAVGDRAIGLGGVAVGSGADGGYGVAIGQNANGNSSGAAVGESANATSRGVALGAGANGYSYGSAIGYFALATNDGVAIGDQSIGSDSGTAIGSQANGQATGTAVGNGANGAYLGTAVGRGADGYSYGVALGNGSTGTNNGIAVGRSAKGSDNGIAIGFMANGRDFGAAVGYGASGLSFGAAMGYLANAQTNGVAIGKWANGAVNGTALGMDANGVYHGATVGYGANGRDHGAAVGYNARGDSFGAALGRNANAAEAGAAVGRYATALSGGVALGEFANGNSAGVALGGYANGYDTGLAIGRRANAADSGIFENRIAIGHSVTNDIDNSIRVRGNLYLDGSDGNIYYRNTFGGSAMFNVKTFVIDHPLDPENKVLRHYTLEGPEVWNVYAGNVQLVNGRAVVELPDYYSALNKEDSEVCSLTPWGDARIWVLEIEGNRLIIGGSDDVKVSWEVKALRNDPACLEDLERRPVEQLKRELAPGQAAREAAAANTMAVTLR